MHHQKVPWLFQELLLDPSRAAKSEPLLGHGVMGSARVSFKKVIDTNGNNGKILEIPGIMSE